MANETLHLHFGVHPDHLQGLRRALVGNVMFVDGDGWYAWGNRPGTAGNDTTTRHAVFETTADRADVLVERARKQVPLVTETWGGDAEVYAVLTEPDWSQERKAWAL